MEKLFQVPSFLSFDLTQTELFIPSTWRDDIFPKLVEFRPDLILISAGFDAHKKDTINAGYISIVS